MNRPALYSLSAVERLIEQDRVLLLAGDEELLSRLPAGRWVGGTSAYFMTEQGGLSTNRSLFVNDLTEHVRDVSIRSHSERDLAQMTKDRFDHGLSFVVIPASSPAHLSFARNAPDYPGIYQQPQLGWIAGVEVEQIGRRKPKVFAGRGGAGSDQEAVVMHLRLPEEVEARVGILNPFHQGEGEPLFFPKSTFEVEDCLVRGEKRSFAQYLQEQRADTRLPLVADYSGAPVNVSIQRIREEDRVVQLYAPVFEGVAYRLARPLADYREAVTRCVSQVPENRLLFSCNCILNYLYGSLEGYQTGSFVGPITFGEIAYQLLNQTLVYLELIGRKVG